MTVVSIGMPHEPDWVREVLSFWFLELGPKQWFGKDADVDARIRARFGALHAQLLATQAAGVESLAAKQAAIIVLDQFSRNLHRDDARAFAADAIARRLAREVVDAGGDSGLPAEQRMFVYLPFEHSESLADQERACELMRPLGEDLLDWAVRHKAIIDRFGRFPHRNAILGRDSTPEEIEFLKKPGSGF
jgi:uncharacterized protein (DUF924 family)